MDGFPGRLSSHVTSILAEMDAQGGPRGHGIRFGSCQYHPTRSSVEAFVAKWDCIKQEGSTIVIYGDSHAADKAWAFRSGGAKIANIGAAGCPLTHSSKRPDCTALLEKLLQLARTHEVSGIVLAHKWALNDMHEENFRSIYALWSQTGVPILMFTPMPEFRQIKDKISRFASAARPLSTIAHDEELLQATSGFVERFSSMPGFTILNTRELFCGAASGDLHSIPGGTPIAVRRHSPELAGCVTIWRALSQQSRLAGVVQIPPDYRTSANIPCFSPDMGWQHSAPRLSVRQCELAITWSRAAADYRYRSRARYRPRQDTVRSGPQ